MSPPFIRPSSVLITYYVKLNNRHPKMPMFFSQIRDYVTIFHRKNFAELTVLMTLSWRDGPGLLCWAQYTCMHT